MANYNSDYTGAQIDSAVSRANSSDVTAGTVAASKAVVVDSNKDITGFRHITATGTVTAANVSLTGNVDLGDASGDTVTITGSIDSNLIPAADDTYDIGSSSYAWQDLYLEGDLYFSDATEIDVASGNLTVDVAGDIEFNADGGDISFKDASSTLAAIDSSGDFNVAGSIETATIDYTDGDLAMTIADGGGVTFAQTSSQVSGSTIGNVTIANGSITDSSGTISFGDENITSTGVGTFASLDISGNADIDGTMEADAYTVDGTALNEYIADTVGAMVGSNTETNITVTYEDSDNTLDFVIGTLNQDTTGTADNITVSANNSSDETVYPIFVDGATGSQGAESDTGLTYNPSSGLLTSTLFAGTLNTAAQGNVTSLGTLTALTVDNIAIDGTTIGHTGDTDLITLTSGVVTVAGEVDATSLDISGDADIDGTLEADAITVDGTTLAEYITDQAGGMFSSNTESGITVTFQDSDNTVDLSVDAAQTGITSLLATDIKIGEDDQTKIDFEDADKINFYAGNEKQLILEDGALYPGSDNIIDLGKSDNEFKDAFFDGTVTADAFAGPITGAVTGNADTATLATTVTVTNSTANTNFPVVFNDESNALLDDTGSLYYNPSTETLRVPNLSVAGTTTTVDTVTMNAQNAIVFEGATADSSETTLSIVDPTSDHTQYLINQGGYIPVLAAATTTAISATPEEINLIDGGTARGTTAVASGDGILINDGGTMRMTNVDTVSTYFASHNVGGSNIVTTGALNSGSITSGFGTIDTGSSNITTTGVGAFGSLDISGNVDVDGTLEADAITVESVALATYIRDTVGTNMVSSNTESGITVTYDTTNDNIDFAVDASQTGLTSILNASLVAGRDADNQIKFSTDDEIIFRVAGGDGVTMKASGEIEATSLDISGDIDVDGTANLDVVDIDGAVDMASTLTVSGSTGSAYIGSFTNTSATGWGAFVKGGADNADYSLRVQDKDANDLFSVKGGGRTGIGTNDPSNQLHLESATSTTMLMKNTGNSGSQIDGDANRSSADSTIMGIVGKWNGTSVGDMLIVSGSDTTNKDDGEFVFRTAPSGSLIERLRIKANGDVQFGSSGGTGDIYHYGEGKFAINDSAGSASTPTYSFNSDTDTGMYRGTANTLRFATGGAERIEVTSAQTKITGQFKVDAPTGDDTYAQFYSDRSTDGQLIHTTAFVANNSASEATTYADIRANIVDNSDTTEDGSITFRTMKAGTMTEHLTLESDSVVKSTGGIYFTGTALAGADTGISSSGHGGDLRVYTNGSQSTTFKSDGRVLVGSGAIREMSGVSSQFQVEGTSYDTSSMSLVGNTGTSSGAAPIIFFGRSRGTSDGSSTVAADGDRLGALFFCGADGTDINTVAASIDVEVDGTPGGNDMPGRIVFKTNSGTSAATARWNIPAAGSIIPEADNTYNIGSSARQVSVLYTANSVVVSDETKKENIKDCDLGIDFVNTLKPKSYNIKNLEETHDDYNKKHYGLIAQDLKDGKLKDSVFGDKDGEYGLNYNDLIAPLIKAVQELSAKVEALENA
jgi:cytoskeletal protein CcmA (bactofilin family)